MNPDPVEVDQILKKCLEEIFAGSETIDSVLVHDPRLNDQLRPELEAAVWCRKQANAFDPRPGFISASRSRLVNYIRGEKQIDEYQERGSLSFRWLKLKPDLLLRWVAIMALVVFAIFSTSGIAHASQNALPGDPFYKVKIGLEDFALALSTNHVNDAYLHIKFAQRRLLEMQMLTLEGRFDEIAPLAKRYEQHLSEALLVMSDLPTKDPANLQALADALKGTVAGQAHFMDFLSQSVPADTKQTFERITVISNESLDTANDLLGLSVSAPTLASAPERIASTGTPTQVVELVETPPVRSTVVVSSDAASDQMIVIIPVTTSTSTLPVDSRSTSVPAFTPTPTESLPALIPAITTTVVVEGGEEQAKVPKPTKISKLAKEPKPTKTPKPAKIPKIKDK